MSKPPRFFVPAATQDNEEAVYAELARSCRCAVPPLGRRIYSITYRHDGDEWTATVGDRLHGVRRRSRRSRGRSIERIARLDDPATVLAIFEGVPLMVVTNHRLFPGSRSAWESPFMVGQSTSVRYFSQDDPEAS